MKWYIAFENFALCHVNTTDPIAFDSREACQNWLNNNCSDPTEEYELILTDDPAQVKAYIASKNQ